MVFKGWKYKKLSNEDAKVAKKIKELWNNISNCFQLCTVKAVIGKMKDETKGVGIEEFVKLKPHWCMLLWS